jgi:hypothetical protein
MIRGLVVTGPRPPHGITAQITNADIEDVSRLAMGLLVRVASGLIDGR